MRQANRELLLIAVRKAQANCYAAHHARAELLGRAHDVDELLALDQRVLDAARELTRATDQLAQHDGVQSDYRTRAGQRARVTVATR